MSTKGIDDGYIGDENDVVYGPSARACCEKKECKAIEFLMRPISSMSTVEIQEYLKNKEHDEEEQKRQKLQTAKQKLVVTARELLLLESDLSTEESKVISTIFATFHNY